MGKSEYREILNRMRVLITHLLKWIFQQEHRSRSWLNTIAEQRDELNSELQDNTNYMNYAKDNYIISYEKGRLDAVKETKLPLKTFSESPLFTFEQMLDEKYLPK
jgi:hypothetical protein